ncbi:MAG: guanylate kinase [Gemmatimonadales bacterium]|nr:guanylate kinase [Gemmatimonadales bacterium]NIN50137.1 guanylate kinase [Gemmatimonadales bacterium]NIP07601.1 guanylate kinase [Gemmatimonadales bacterium]NIR01753.1 guanylate kinase [Gemmatimonadales bacterium]NIS65656.1 guanylate kinase [Gemmatimonadales bacterium]
MSPCLVILSAPSGGGKTTIAKELLAGRHDLGYSISATTRPPRPDEREGVDYYFVSRDEFLRQQQSGELLESAEYGGHLYGTLVSEVDRVLAQGRHVILVIDVQGARQIRERRSDVVSIFILPPSADVLVGRLRGRASDGAEDLSHRLERADRELQQAATYDYVVVNDDVSQAVAEVSAIIDAETRRTARRSGLREMIAALRQELEAIAKNPTP